MTFKNKKEEVIEIQLTSYGKHLLSLGKMYPCFYSFHDDDIMYDSQYGGPSYEQNYEQVRILEETPRSRLQVYNFGVETEVEDQIRNVRDKEGSFAPTIERSLNFPLARSALYSDFVPSWDITIHGKPDFSDYEKMSTFHSVVSIENTTFYTYVSDMPPPIRQYSEIDSIRTEYDNGHSIVVESSEFVIEVDEEHTVPLSENYDIEVYKIERKNDGSLSEKILLNFIKSPSSVKIIDEVLYEEDIRPVDIQLDSSYVEYYLDIRFDREISKELLCELGYRTDYSKRGYIPVDCGDVDLDISSVYDTDEPKPPFGDDC